MLGNVSIHARVKRATVDRARCQVFREGFNPRPREAGDSLAQWIVLNYYSFNPRPREAGDSVRT